MKRLFVNFMTCAAMATALTLAACSSDSDGEGNGNGNGGNGEGTGSSIVVGDNILSGTLTGEQTLESKEYILNGTVIVADGGRLNIPAGTTIKAREGFTTTLAFFCVPYPTTTTSSSSLPAESSITLGRLVTGNSCVW